MSTLIRLAIAFILAGTLSSCDRSANSGATPVSSALPMSPAHSISVSSDGRHAISVHADQAVVLWDLENKTQRLVSRNGNLYSAYFVKGTPYYMWQNVDGQVIIQSLDGEEMQRFSAPPVYGHVLSSDLQTYIYADIGWGVYRRWPDGKEEQWKAPWGKAFLGFGKVLNIQFSPDEKKLLQSGYGYEFDTERSLNAYTSEKWKKLVTVALWDSTSAEPEAVLPGNIAKTIATFSPDGRYVVSGSENGVGYVWDITSIEHKHMLAGLYSGIFIGEGKNLDNLYGEAFSKAAYDKSRLIPAPEDFSGEAIISLKFIDQNHYLRFTTYQHYAILYKVDNPLPLKYLDLGTHPFPATTDYSRNLAIDTAPEAGILVMGEANGPGILVYRYDPERKTLGRIWASSLPEWRQDDKRDWRDWLCDLLTLCG